MQDLVGSSRILKTKLTVILTGFETCCHSLFLIAVILFGFVKCQVLRLSVEVRGIFSLCLLYNQINNNLINNN